MVEQTNIETVLDELRHAYDVLNSANDALDSKLNNLLNYSSVILAFAATIQISTLESKVGIIFWVLVLIALALYVVNFILIRHGLNPRPFHLTMSGDRDTLVQMYIDSPKNKSLSQIIGNYLDAIEEINSINKRKAQAIEISYHLLIGIVTVLILAVPLGLHWSSLTLLDLWNRIPH